MLRAESYKNYRVAVAISLLLATVLAIFVAVYGKNDSFLIINQLNSPRFDGFFIYVTSLGDGLIWIPLFLYILLWNRPFLFTAIAALLICTILTHLMKRVIFPHEFRPIVVLEEKVRIIEGLQINRANSFPSGHTSTAFTLMLLLVFLLRKRFWAFTFPLVAFFVGYSRVYLAQHFVTDVLAGLVVGVISSYLSLLLFEYYKKKQQDQVQSGRSEASDKAH